MQERPFFRVRFGESCAPLGDGASVPKLEHGFPGLDTQPFKRPEMRKRKSLSAISLEKHEQRGTKPAVGWFETQPIKLLQ